MFYQGVNVYVNPTCPNDLIAVRNNQLIQENQFVLKWKSLLLLLRIDIQLNLDAKVIDLVVLYKRTSFNVYSAFRPCVVSYFL